MSDNLTSIYYDNRGFIVRYPQNWKYAFLKNILIFISPKENHEDDFSENINLQVQKLTGEEPTLDTFTGTTQKVMAEKMHKARDVTYTDISIGKRKAVCLDFKVAAPKRNLQIRQYWFVENKRAFLFTYTAEESQFGKYADQADALVQSFQFGKMEMA